MSALLVTKPQQTELLPVNLPLLRAVSAKPAIDVPQLSPVAPAPRPRLSVVSEQHERVVSTEHQGLERLVGALKVGVIVAASVAFAIGLQLWLSL